MAKENVAFSEDIFMRLEKENALKLLFSGLYPVLINSQDKLFFVPSPMGLLGLNEEQLKRFMEWYDTESWNLGVHAFTNSVATSFLTTISKA
jgi:hypothetical protein